MSRGTATSCKKVFVFFYFHAALTLFVIYIILICGCSNSYKNFYRGATLSNNKNKCRIEGKYAKGASQEVIANMRSRGFTYIGSSSFVSTDWPSDMDALSACNSIGGDAVYVMVPEYRGSLQYEYETIQYHPGQSYYQTSTTHYNGNSYYNGSIHDGNNTYYYGGNVNNNGTATTTTTYGRTPDYITTQSHYATAVAYSYEALFFYYDEMASRVNNYADSQEENESRNNYAECMRREDYVEPNDVCTGGNTAIEGKVYWNPQMQKCMPYKLQSDHVIHFCK